MIVKMTLDAFPPDAINSVVIWAMLESTPEASDTTHIFDSLAYCSLSPAMLACVVGLFLFLKYLDSL